MKIKIATRFWDTFNRRKAIRLFRAYAILCLLCILFANNWYAILFGLLPFFFTMLVEFSYHQYMRNKSESNK